MSTSPIISATGASSGIGKATAERLIQDDHTDYGAARRVDKMRGLESQSGRALCLDVADEALRASAVQTVLNVSSVGGQLKTRYAAGKRATLVQALRRWLPDRLLDTAILSQVPYPIR